MAERRLSAIPVLDVVGYSDLVGADETGTLTRLRARRSDSVDPLIAAHGGRIFKTTGDGLLAEHIAYDAADPVALQDEIIRAVAGILAPTASVRGSQGRIGCS